MVDRTEMVSTLGAALLLALSIYFFIGKEPLEEEATRELVESDLERATPCAEAKLQKLHERGILPTLTLKQLSEAETLCEREALLERMRQDTQKER